MASARNPSPSSGNTETMRVFSRPLTFVTGNAKKLEEVRAILCNSIPFQSLKLDCKPFSISSFPSPTRSFALS
ncbi:Inosine triphosphate pyrophosphatase [Platanthera zijinensis]|uniref:Inosine triphosphate pyrophosphatase n=1 Tax=Platanthera zijinensis TaxID=2320716 RepID=A0AAP0BFB6_9ASPA